MVRVVMVCFSLLLSVHTAWAQGTTAPGDPSVEQAPSVDETDVPESGVESRKKHARRFRLRVLGGVGFGGNAKVGVATSNANDDFAVLYDDAIQAAPLFGLGAEWLFGRYFALGGQGSVTFWGADQPFVSFDVLNVDVGVAPRLRLPVGDVVEFFLAGSFGADLFSITFEGQSAEWGYGTQLGAMIGAHFWITELFGIGIEGGYHHHFQVVMRGDDPDFALSWGQALVQSVLALRF